MTKTAISAPRKPGHPKRPGILVRVPCRFERQEDYDLVVSRLSIDARGDVLLELAKQFDESGVVDKHGNYLSNISKIEKRESPTP